jgi:cell division protein FtsI (penicillin-binding protein 3)
MLIVVLFVFSLFAAQLLRVQAFDASATQAAALSKRSVKLHTPAMRGQILDTNDQVLADSVERFTIAADPVAIQCYVKVDGECGWQGVYQAAQDLSPRLGLDVARLTTLFTKPDTRYVIVRKDVTPDEWRAIQAVGVPGIAAERTSKRVYPTSMALGQLVGYVNQADQTPGGGVELMLEETLAGRSGTTVAERAQNGAMIPGSQRVDQPAADGRNVRLTIDSDIQWYAQNALAKQVTAVKAETGTAVVLEVATGKIRAAASYPTFDPHDLSKASKASLRNHAFEDAFEPGSTGKLMTMAAALEHGVVTPDTGVIIPNRLPRAGMKFKDHENHETEHMTATGVIAQSSNIGTILVGERVPPADMEAMYRKFGVGQKTEVGFAGESSGQLAKASDWNAPQRYTVLFGQGYALTAVQAASVFATVANGGIRMPLSLVEGTYNDSGTFVPAPAEAGNRVLTDQTATQLSRMLEEVTGEDGTASDARIEGYRVAGKTGTADRYDDELGRYDGFTASFIGYAPAEKPKYVVAVFIHKPQAGMFGGALAGPVFNQLMTYLLQRENTPPSTKSDLDFRVWADKRISAKDPDVLSDARARRDGL